MNDTNGQSANSLAIGSIFLVLVQLAMPSSAAEWRIIPTLLITETYLDNVEEAPPGEEESDYVTELNPGISLQAQGSRLNLNLNYSMQNLFYIDNSDENTTNHELSADANVELLREHLFLDAFASAQQVLVSPEGRGGNDNLTITDDRTTAITYTISPYAVRRFGNMAGELRYAFEKVDFLDDGADTAEASDSHRLFANLASDPSARRLSRPAGYRTNIEGITASSEEATDAGLEGRNRQPRRYVNDFQWSLTYSRDQTDFQDDTDEKFELLALDTSYRIGARTAALLGLGYENNDFDQSAEADQPEGFFWYTGIAWNPSRRTALEATVGRRFFGTTYSLAFRHNTRTITTDVQYAEEFVTTADTILEEQLSSNGDESSNPETGVPLPQLGSEVYLRKRLTGSISKTTAKSTFQLSAYDEDREFQRSDSEEQAYGITFGWDWQLASRTDSRLFAEWQRLESSQEDQEDFDSWQIGASINRRIRNTINAYFDYRYSRRDSTDPENDYKQNQIAAGLQITF